MRARFGLIGRRLPHSYSPRIHQLLADYPYDLWELEPENVPAFMRGKDFDACNVTIPYKETVIPFLDVLDATAIEIGSVNTVVKGPDGRLTGYNTDGFGFRYMLESAGIDPAGKKVAILGSGGTSKTAKYVCSKMGARETVVVSRAGAVSYGDTDRYADAEILINCTPVGMYPNNLAVPVDIDRFSKLLGFADVIYNPNRTLLTMEAEQRGIPAVTGLSMLVAQAKKAAEFFTGEAIPDPAIDRVTRQIFFENSNIVLIGMPGSGKTTVGSALAERLGRQFVDTDEELRVTLGTAAGDYINLYGEAAFREQETKIMERFGKEKQLVIATGGGLVTVPKALYAARQNAVVVFLNRPLDQLATEGRPLSAKKGVEALWQERGALYKKGCDLEIDAGGTAVDCVDAILKAVCV